MKKFILLLVVATTLVACEEKNENTNTFPQIPEICQEFVPNSEPKNILSSTDLFTVKLHYETFVLHEKGVLVSNEFSKYKDLTKKHIKIISLRDLIQSINEAKQDPNSSLIRFKDAEISTIFEEKGKVYVRNKAELYAYDLTKEVFFIQLVTKNRPKSVSYNWFPMNHKIWEY